MKEEKRTCIKCGEEKLLNLDFFPTQTKKRGGKTKTYFKHTCRSCINEKAKKDYHSRSLEYKKRQKELRDAWVAAHPDRVKQYKKNWELKNPEAVKYYRKKRKKKDSLVLKDYIIRGHLQKQFDLSLEEMHELPDSVIELKRSQLLLIRELRNQIRKGDLKTLTCISCGTSKPYTEENFYVPKKGKNAENNLFKCKKCITTSKNNYNRERRKKIRLAQS